jgi:bacterioferritin (cytochrome b1)
MQFNEIVAKLNDDLKNEWKHFKFYLHHASAITGLHAHEYKEFLLEQAASEMKHVSQFSDMIVGLGSVPTVDANDFPRLTTATEILQYAFDMEAEVVKNYTQRIAQLDEIKNTDDTVTHKKWIEIFLEKQIEDSRQDLDHIRQILKGV